MSYWLFVICALQASHNLIISGPRRTVTASAQAVAHIARMNFFILQPDGQARLVPFSISPGSQQSLAQPAWLYRTSEHSCLLRVQAFAFVATIIANVLQVENEAVDAVDCVI